MHETVVSEKALLVLVEQHRNHWPQEIIAQEFKALVNSTSIKVIDLVSMKLRQPNSGLFIGKGKVEELALLVKEKQVNVVIFNNNLNMRQQRNLEDVLLVKTIDRTQLILDIFAHHARTQEGILQVELAQLEYLLPRLKGQGIMLSRLGGGIGTIGPGEKKLEIDRRKIAERIDRLNQDLSEVKKHRQVLRQKREKLKLPLCSLVGYTSAGKTTLFNLLTASNEKISQDLFTTLDPVTRNCFLHDNMEIVIADTVGFIDNLPANLIEAFKATLEELQYADLLIHVIDSTNPYIDRLIDAVDNVLKELELSTKETLMVFNKIDSANQETIKQLQHKYPQAIFISALTGTNIKDLQERIYKSIFANMVELVIRFPFKQMDLVKDIHHYCEVLKKDYKEDEVVYWVRVKKEELHRFNKPGVIVKEV